ncbi:hypothetical protein ACFX1T_010176 [Malus domestica]
MLRLRDSPESHKSALLALSGDDDSGGAVGGGCANDFLFLEFKSMEFVFPFGYYSEIVDSSRELGSSL